MAISEAIRREISLTLATLAYVTFQDIRKITGHQDQTVIVVKAPPETRLEVPDSTESLQIHLASTQAPTEEIEDQIPSNLEGLFVNLVPPLLQEDYLLSLGEEDSIIYLFDACDLEKLPLVEDFMTS
ncbi:Transcription factor E2F3 [Heterocephalus glaber]|uniref:Transcription factor E2F3 n=1 Tax=Heterocephalus glaber TaxID=10181 RepID=G5C9H7_HETGA|nr:Transcription factor E2F3 [Heterocephalus glaber]